MVLIVVSEDRLDMSNDRINRNKRGKIGIKVNQKTLKYVQMNLFQLIFRRIFLREGNKCEIIYQSLV